MRTPTVLCVLLATTSVAAPPGIGPLAAGPAQAAAGRQIAYTSWDTGTELASGTLRDVRVARGTVTLAAPSGTRRYAGATYERGSWTSPWTTPGFALTELVPSWEATTPRGTFVEVAARGRTASGTTGSWDSLGRWATYDGGFTRTSPAAQPDDLARVATDTLVAASSFTSWQLRVTLLRRAGSSATPVLDAAGAMVSRLPSSTGVSTSAPGVARGVTLDVPRFSQMIHEGHYPEYDNGGEAWCSPTSLAMVLGYYGALPPPADYAWVPEGHPDPVVDHLARMTYDAGYQGTGNWPFNTAYAATRVEEAFVTRFASLRGVEQLVAAGIPVVTSLEYGAGGLTGSPLTRGSNGHLMVVVGFTEGGDVVVNDPAASSRRGVRRTYDRGEFEDAWLKRGSAGGSGGIAYVVRDAAHPLPAREGSTSW